jgi:hypothetical protein
MTKKRRYQPRVVGDKVMMPADLKRLHKYMLEVEHIGVISERDARGVPKRMARAGPQAAAEDAPRLS